MQELDEGGGGAVRRRIAWEYPSDARPNDGERGCLRALRLVCYNVSGTLICFRGYTDELRRVA